ncbi:MAG: class II fructose-bisphosphatase [bacterium]
MDTDRLSQHALKLTEEAAIAASRYVGKGDKNAADQAAVDAMRDRFRSVPIDGRVVIGEGEKDEAPMLYIGEEVGSASSPRVDIAVDPLEGTTLTAEGSRRALCVLAMAPDGSFLHAPDVYMMKLAVGAQARGAIDIEDDFAINVERVADAKNKELSSLTCVLLDRDRNREYIETLRELDCRVRLIDHGDISAALSACVPETEVDLLAGIGNSAEGVLSAAAIQCFDGDFEAQLNPIGDSQHERLDDIGIEDHEKTYSIDDLAEGEDVVFSCTGVTEGDFLDGVHVLEDEIYTESLLITSDNVRRTVSSRFTSLEQFENDNQPPLPGVI